MPKTTYDKSVSARKDTTRQNGRQDNSLLAAFSSFKTAKELERFLVDLCTPAELRALKARWQVAQLLDAGEMSYRDISEKTGASTTTVGRVARFLNEEPHQGYRLALDRLRASS
ncbi:MAG: TrpR like protein, YerC/YecD [Robiginitomaculum sp.]|nr:TrpR like protein, YerC/YecD [Robiginitomaculum sp.]